MDNDQHIKQRIARAKELIKAARHACMATVNPDGTPHATPFYLILDKTLRHVYFGSHPDSQHTKNVVRTSSLFIAIYDIRDKGGLYLRAVNGHELSGAALTEGLAAHNAVRARDGKSTIEQAYYEGTNPQRMYGADIDAFWVNVESRDESGQLMREYRHEVSAGDLLEDNL